MEFDLLQETFRGRCGNHFSGGSRHGGNLWQTDGDLASTAMYVVDEPPLLARLTDVRLVEADGDDVLLLDAERRLVVRLTRP